MIQKGATAFRDHYEKIFGSSTEKIIESLKHESKPVLLFSNRNQSKLFKIWTQIGLVPKTLTWYPYALEWPDSVPLGDTLPGYQEKLFFPISSSSLLPVIALDLKPTDHVLDACAAPGGKSLIIANHLNSATQLHANDLSPDRVVRLKRTFKDYLFSSVVVSEMPAERLAIRHEIAFDKILIDAPCSSEQHVLASPKHLAQWSKKRIQSLQKRQKSLIRSLSYALKPAGLIVYATCAITPEENESIVEEIVKDRDLNLDLVPWTLHSLPGGSGLEVPGLTYDHTWVRRLLPGRDEGDPIFIAVFQKSNTLGL